MSNEICSNKHETPLVFLTYSYAFFNFREYEN